MASDKPIPRPIDVRAAQGVQIGDGDIQINFFAPRPEVQRPWMSPALSGPVTGRPDLYSAVFDGVMREDAGPTTLTTAIEGSGGFGKTTLAAMLCHDPRIAAHFTGGLLWCTVGERSRGARLAQLVGGLCEVLSGDTVTTANPQAAGGRLGELLDARGPVLLVVDDVWRPEQLSPFMIGGRSCRRLVTTRNASVAPRQGVSILVDVMTTEQAIATLTDGVGDAPGDLLARLVAVTSRWPLLLGLVNAALVDQIAAGANVEHAVRWVLRRLETGGPAVFDVDLGDEDNRGHAVRATVEASLALLSPHERDRYFDLAILPEDALFPAGLLSRLWRAAGLSTPESERLHALLGRLRLVLRGWQDEESTVRLHGVLSTYLRHQLTDEQLARRHGLMVRAAAELLPPSPRPRTPWWSMPSDVRYLWHHLPYHLAHSGRVEERDALVLDLRWVAAKAATLLSSVPVEVDLADVPGEAAKCLRRALGSIAELVMPGDPPSALDATPATAGRQDAPRPVPSPHS